MKHLHLMKLQSGNFKIAQPFLSGKVILPALFMFMATLLTQAQIVSNTSGGNWSSPATWVGGVVPTAIDDVVIADGSLVTVDNTAATCANLTVGQGSSGKVTYTGGTTAAYLTVNGNMTVSAGAIFDAGVGSGTNTKRLNLGGSTAAGNFAGNLTVNGTFDMGSTTELATAGPTGLLTFFGVNNAIVSGNPIIFRLNAVTVNKGTNSTSEVDVQAVVSMRTPGSAAGTPRLTITSGTFKLSSASAITPYFAGDIICAAAGRLWVNNAGASISSAGGSTGTASVNGELRISSGRFNYGTGADVLSINGTLNITGGNLNLNGRLLFANASTFTMNAGAIAIDPQNTASLGATVHIVQFGTSTAGTPTVNFTGGTMTIVNPHAAASATGIAFSITATSGLYNFTGSNVIFGDGVSTKAGSTDGFEINTASAALGNVTVNNTPSNPANRHVRLSGNSTISGTLTINAQSEFRLFGFTLNLRGAFTNNGTFTANEVNSHLILSGTNAQTFGIGNYTGSSITQLTINNGSGVTLSAALNCVTLNMTLGKLISSTTNLMSVTGTTVASITGGSSGSYVDGPLSRALPGSLATGSTYAFPVGKSAYQLFEMVNPTTSAAGTVTVEVFDANSNGTAGLGLGALNTNRYWTATPSGSFIRTTAVRLTEGTLGSANRIGQSTTVNGSYSSRGGSAISPMLSGNVGSTLGAFVLGTASSTLSAGTYTVGASGQLVKLTDVANLLNTSTLSGNVTFEMQPDYDGTFGETFPISFKQFATSGGNWMATIRPASGAPALTTSGDQVTSGATIGLISFDSSATNITIDGRPGGTGTSIGWTFRNTRTAGTVGATFRFINGANKITLNYLQIEGQNLSTASGTILFTTATGGLIGNSFNTISNCVIGNRTDGLGTASPAIGIYSAGTAGKLNSDNTIINNRIFNFTSTGIYVNGTTNGDNWTVSGNSFYSTLSATTTQTAINLSPGTAAGNYTIHNNYIGGRQPLAGGNTWTNSNNGAFTGIYLTLSGIVSSSVQGNVIQNILLSGTGGSSFTGIQVEAGRVNIGDVTANLIGSATVSNSIQVFGTGVTRGIYSSPTAATDVINIHNNTIANLNASNNGAAVYITGIYADGGTNNIRGNKIYNLSTNSSNVGLTNTASVTGIVNVSTAASSSQTIAANHIHSLTNTFLAAAVSVIGVYFGTTTTTQTYEVSRNLIHNFSTTSQVVTTQQIGIHGASNSRTRVSNNMISIGHNPAGASETLSQTMIGFNKSGTGSYHVFHNSVYVGGTGVGTDTTRTFAYRRIAAGADTVLNNLFVNKRSNATTGGKHYAIFLTNKTGLILNNNAYYANGNGSVFGFDAVTNRTDLAAWQAANTSFDLTSFVEDPNFVMAAGSAVTTDLHLAPGSLSKIESGAIQIQGLNDDFDATNVRGPYPLSGQTNGGGSAPDLGADESDILPFDFDAPEISYTPISSSCSLADRTVNVTISKAFGNPVPVAGTFAPRIYYRKGNGNYFSRPGTITSGNGFFGTWNFTIVNADMGGVANGDSIYYYIIAQDSSTTPDINSEPAGAIASTVNNIVTEPTPFLYAVGSLPAPTITQSGDTLTSSSAATYQWYRDNNQISGATSQSYVTTQSGSYTVMVSDGSGCNATSAPYSIIFTGIKTQDELTVSLYPNPVKGGQVNLSVPSAFIGLDYMVYSLNGNVVKSGTVTSTLTNLDVSSLSSGIYYVRLNRITKSFVKE